jgi:AdoMet-dependent heme synthase
VQAKTSQDIRESPSIRTGTAIAQASGVPFVFDAAPKRIYWELTRACDLACRHCRADANPCADPRELRTPDIFRILDEIAAEATPHVVFTGGDPLKRLDFFDIIEHTVGLGLPCNVSPSATPLLTPAVIKKLEALRVAAMSLSLDGSTAERHDALRGVGGTFAQTLQIARQVAQSRIALQINTLVTAETVDDLPDIHRVVREIDADRWSLFFLITTGRGRSLGQLSSDRAEAVLSWALDRAADRRPIVTTTEAPHYRRLAVTRQKGGRDGTAGRPMVQGLGIRDGNGVMFISHIGEVQPSGFLPLTAGSARTENPLRIYRESPLFQDLRRTESFTGRCGCCEFREICGGSRARAYAATGDPLGSDPLCAYLPPAALDRQAMMRD